LLAAACRAADIPARLGFADVCNHMSTTRMTEMLGSDIFYYHGYTSILIEGNWVKATPAFNQQLCEISGLLPLEFDGETDSIFHPFDKAGKRHMEYLNYRGEFDDVPFDDLIKTFAEKYPNLQALDSYSWDKDIAEEQIHRP
jgi:transglutaminase-like putative cysteine protease